MSSEAQNKWQSPAGSTGVESSALDRAEALLKEDRLDINELAHFFAKGFSKQAVQSWSYYAQVNDHAKFTAASSTLAKLLKSVAEDDDLTEHGVQMIKEILISYNKTLYRALSSMRASTANPVLRLINEIVSFKNGALLDDFVALFDFTLSVLPKLLLPTKTEAANPQATKEKGHFSIRYNFIRVIINIFKYSAPLLRKDFISNHTKIISNWFKYIASADSEALIIDTLAILDEKILKESSFKKASKLKVLNEWNITKLLPLYYTSNKELRSALNKFIIAISTDSKYGLKFSPDETWFLSTSNNAPLEVNKKHFKTHNKVIYTILSGLKPWDDDMQLNTTVQILQGIPELIPPYTNYLASRGLHDPKLTSYWIGQTLLLSKIINLDVPEEIEEYTGLDAPSKLTIAETIVPSVLNRSVLSKCLQSDSFLIRQLSAQLVMNSVLKLKKYVEVYDSNKWHEAKVDLINHIYHTLPDLSTVTNCISDSYTKKSDNKILLVALLMVMNSYLTLFSDNHNFSQAISKPYMDVLNEKQYSSIDLVLLGNFLQLQEGDSTQLKWWNKSDNSNSLFTSLLKIASSRSAKSVSSKVKDLLSNLLKQTVVFNNDHLKVDPAELLIHSLQLIVGEEEEVDNDSINKIWNLLDESISRCVRTPFKYLDISNDNSRISPLIVTLFEQWKFVDKTTSYKLTSKWFVIFLRLLIISGEPASAVSKFISEAELDFDYSDFLLSNNLEESIPVLDSDEHLSSDVSFFGVVTTSPLDKIQNAGIPVSDLGIVGAFLRIHSAVQSKHVPFKRFQSIFSDLLSNIGNYLYTHPEATKKFSSRKYWSELYLTEDSEKCTFVSGVLIEIFSQLDGFDKGDLSDTVKVLLSHDLSKRQEEVVGDSLWTLSNDDLRSVLSHNSLILQKSALELMVERKMTIESSKLTNLLPYPDLISALSKFVSEDLVVFGDLQELFTAVVSGKDALQIVRSLVKAQSVLSEFVTFISTSDDANLITFMASALTPQVIETVENKDLLTTIFTSARSTAQKLIESEDFSFMSFEELSCVFTNQTSDPSEEEKNTVLTYALEKNANKFAPEIPTLMKNVSTFEDSASRIWLNKSVLYLTKIFAEYPEPPSHFFEFISNFKTLALSIDSSKLMNRANVNALLEVIFTKWVSHGTALELAAIFVVTSTRSFIEFGKLLQILINSDANVLIKSGGATPRAKFLTALIIYRLYEFDVSKNSNLSLQDRILTFYSGSTRPEDLLLFKTLEKLESKLNASWVDQVYSWDFLDGLNENDEELIGETRLIEKKKEGFVVVMNKNYVLNGLNNYTVARHNLTMTNGGVSENWKKAEGFYKTVGLIAPLDVSQTCYDPLFLTLLIVNNDELVSVNAGEGSDVVVKSNMKKLVESNLLTAIVINLASEDPVLLNVSKKLIASLLSSLNTENAAFKERNIFEIFLKKLLYTFERPENDADTLCPLVFIVISRFVTILNNPGHMLYEKVFRWVLKNPFVRSNDIPLFQDITTMSSTSEETDLYYKQLSWLIETLTIAVKTKADIQLLRTKNVFELFMNLLNSPYVDTRLRYQIYNFLSVVQEAEEGDILITRYAGLANLEQNLYSVSAKGTENLQQTQEILNLRELAVKYGIIGQSKKRLADWTDGDIENFTKRTMTL